MSDTIIDSLKWRYATKIFDHKRIIESEKIDRICEAFNLTATSYGLQPIKLLVIQNKEIQAKILPLAFDQLQVSTASHILILCIENSIDTDFIASYFKNIKNKRTQGHDEIDAYQEVLNSRFEIKTKEEIKLWATKQAYLALGNLLTVCALEKIDSCPMEGFLPQQLDELLELNSKGISSVLLLPIGYRSKEDNSSNAAKVRRPLKESIQHIF